MSVRTIFLSHSSKDVEKVRKIRDILESLEFEPLLFHMKCLDDENEVLEDFIKKEIDARNIFVYCKSKNAEASAWVQKEVSYIQRSPNKRMYEIDIERPLRETLVSFLYALAEIVKQNSVFIACSGIDDALSEAVSAALTEKGYEIIRYRTYAHEACEKHDDDIKRIAQNGIFLPIITQNFLNSVRCMSEIEKVLYDAEQNNVVFKPIFFHVPPSLAMRQLPTVAQSYRGYKLNDPSLSDPEELQAFFRFLVENNREY
jgi:hypothetical protein